MPLVTSKLVTIATEPQIAKMSLKNQCQTTSKEKSFVAHNCSVSSKATTTGTSKNNNITSMHYTKQPRQELTKFLLLSNVNGKAA